MSKLLQVFITGAVIFMMTVPFYFYAQNAKPELTSLKFSNHSSGINLPDSNKTDSGIIVEKPKVPSTFHMKKSPWKAVLFSAILPGLGQIYNKSYWKAPIILGLSAYLGYQIYDYNKTYKDYKSRYEATQFPPDYNGDLNLKTLRNFYRDQRDNFVWYFVIVYVVNLVDAYIDAHLFDFDVSEQKIIGLGTDRKYNLKMKLNF
jgi:hypothetical protein